jgi:hypothetical protein
MLDVRPPYGGGGAQARPPPQPHQLIPDPHEKTGDEDAGGPIINMGRKRIKILIALGIFIPRRLIHHALRGVFCT